MKKISFQLDTLRTPEYKHIFKLRLVSFGAVGICLLAFSATAAFLYQTVSTTITHIEAITLLQTSVTEVIDFNQLERVRTAWDEKQAPVTSTMSIKNPFVLSSSTPIQPIP